MIVGVFIGAVVFIALYIVSAVYLGRRIQEGLQLVLPERGIKMFYVLYTAASLAMVFGMLPVSFPLKSLVSTLGAYFMGFYAFGLMLFLLRDGVLLLTRRMMVNDPLSSDRGKRITSCLVILSALALSVYGSLHAGDIKMVTYEVHTENQNLREDLHIVLLSDLHLGAVGSEKRLPDLVSKVASLNPDLILIAGDLFDDDFHLLKDPDKAKELLLSMKSTYGTFASLGNHDGGKTLPEMLDFLKESGVKVLQEEFQVIEESFVLLGRLDPSPIGGFGSFERNETSEVLSDLPKHLPLIVMDHTPSQVSQYGEEVDLVVSGHTHKGQIFPFQLGTELLFEVDYGYYQKEAHHPVYIVTSGVGTWGPPMRVGTNSEIVSIIFSKVKS